MVTFTTPKSPLNEVNDDLSLSTKVLDDNPYTLEDKVKASPNKQIQSTPRKDSRIELPSILQRRHHSFVDL